ncbi:MAG: metallophosphoesterase [Clostridia bacterium]|nr:metallophosphoesterase [Clostridia bacterium]
MRLTHCSIKADFELTAAVLADFHSSAKARSKAGLKKTLEVIGEVQPDIILSTGDIFNSTDSRSVKSRHNIKGFELLRGVRQTAPVYLSIGNHEHTISSGNRSMLEEAGICVLDHEFVRYRDIVIGGLTSGFVYEKAYYKGKQPIPDVSMLERFAAESGYKILLCHHPEYWRKYIAGRGIDLTVSGHAHGGQWGFFGGRGVYAPGQGLFPKYVRGLHHFISGGKKETLAVSRGMTNTQPIPRFFNPCEILILHFVNDGKV